MPGDSVLPGLTLQRNSRYFQACVYYQHSHLSLLWLRSFVLKNITFRRLVVGPQ